VSSPNGLAEPHGPAEQVEPAGAGVLTEADDPDCLRPGEASVLLRGHPWRRFAVLGDSVAEGLGDPSPGYSPLPWCDRIAAELRAHRPDLEYLNLGRRDLRAGEVRDQQLERAVGFRPDLALVVCGANDAMAIAYRPANVDAALTTIVRALQESGALVLTVGIFDISKAPCFTGKMRTLMASRMRALSSRTVELSRRLGTIHIDCYGHPLEGDPAMYAADGLHGNMRSHQIFAAVAIRLLGRHLSQ
jgi:lysophospholipase L1-like esterase